MPLSLLQSIVRQSIVRICVAATKPTRQRRSAAGLRSREATMGLESLEQRMALTVAVPSIRLTAASDTGIRNNDGVTKLDRPVFTGAAPARSIVSIYYNGDQLLGTTTSVRGVWSLRPQTALPSGPHTITGKAVLGTQSPITLRPFSMIVDRAAPTIASLTWNSGDGSTLTFSEPVSGVQAANLRLTGRTEVGVLTNVPINDNRARGLVGPITEFRFDNNTKFVFKEQRALAFSGNYTLSFVKTGVVDQAGNPLAAGASYSFTIN